MSPYLGRSEIISLSLFKLQDVTRHEFYTPQHPNVLSTVFSFLLSSQLKVKPEWRLCQLLSLVHISSYFFFSYPTASPNTASVLCHVIPSPPPFRAAPSEQDFLPRVRHVLGTAERIKSLHTATVRSSAVTIRGKGPVDGPQAHRSNRIGPGLLPVVLVHLGNCLEQQHCEPGKTSLLCLFILHNSLMDTMEKKPSFPTPSWFFTHNTPSNLGVAPVRHGVSR